MRKSKTSFCCVPTVIRFTISAVVCDDIEMGITDVIRGQDHLTNTHKQILIYEALGETRAAIRASAADFRAGRKKIIETHSRRNRFDDDLPRRRISSRRVSQFSRAFGLVGGRRTGNLFARRTDRKILARRHSPQPRDFQFRREQSETLDGRQSDLDERRIYSHDAARRDSAVCQSRTEIRQTLARRIRGRR